MSPQNLNRGKKMILAKNQRVPLTLSKEKQKPYKLLCSFLDDIERIRLMTFFIPLSPQMLPSQSSATGEREKRAEPAITHFNMWVTYTTPNKALRGCNPFLPLLTPLVIFLKPKKYPEKAAKGCCSYVYHSYI